MSDRPGSTKDIVARCVVNRTGLGRGETVGGLRMKFEMLGAQSAPLQVGEVLERLYELKKYWSTATSHTLVCMHAGRVTRRDTRVNTPKCMR